MTERIVEVSFVVPAFRARSTITETLRSIRAEAPAASEIIVVDDNSPDDTADVATQIADVVVRRSVQGGAAKTRNDGIRASNGSIVFFIDSDVTVQPGAIEGALRHLERGADAVFGAYEPLPPPSVVNNATVFKNLIHHYTHLTNEGDIGTFWSGFGAVKRVALDAAGWFDPDTTTSADTEDIDLGYNLTNKGYRIVLDPQLRVLHHKRYTLRGMIISDIVHRAIPWTRAMLKHRVAEKSLNLSAGSMAAAGLAYLVLASLVVAPFLGTRFLLVAAVCALGWLFVTRRFMAYTAKVCGPAALPSVAGLLFLYYVYSPLGFIAGVGSHLLRARS